METPHIWEHKETYICVYLCSRKVSKSIIYVRFFLLAYFCSFPTFTNNYSETHHKDAGISRTSSGEHFVTQIQDNFRTGYFFFFNFNAALFKQGETSLGITTFKSFDCHFSGIHNTLRKIEREKHIKPKMQRLPGL